VRLGVPLVCVTICLTALLATSRGGAQDARDVDPAEPSGMAIEGEPARSADAPIDPPSAGEPAADEPASSAPATDVDTDDEGREARGRGDDDGDDDDDRDGDGDDDGDDFWSGFHFGSYGRIVAATDFRGRTGRQARLVTFAPRIDEDDTYAEIELRREDRMFGIDTRIVATVAYGGPLFHYDGEFGERIAIRNLFAETSNILTRGLSIWGGSRMVRGDDVYLLNFWPLDNLNAIGGGLRYALEESLEFALTVGTSQPNDPFQRQTDLFPARTGFLADEVLVLDRPRLVIAGRATYWPFGRLAETGLKAVLYAEQHFLPSGDRRRDDGTTEVLPEDSGYVLGAQVGGYISATRTHANLFFRYARGLGVYDPLGVPFRTGTTITTGRAEEIRLALSANWEWQENDAVGVGLQVGGYWRLLRDADPGLFDRSAVSEGTLSVRPIVWLGQFVGVAADLSVQAQASAALDEGTGNPEGGALYKLGIMPFVTPFGRGSYTRPHIRVLYVVTGRDEGARRLLNDADPRAHQDLEHFFGISVEWWFSSSSYAP
jgi:hypothetical protein